MSAIFAGMIGTHSGLPSPIPLQLTPCITAMSVLVLAEASGAVFYNINTELAYLCLQIGFTLLYTLLVVARLLSLGRKTLETLGWRDVPPYEAAAMMVVESAALYAPLGIVFIIAFAIHSDVTNLIFLSISHVQVSGLIMSLPEVGMDR